MHTLLRKMRLAGLAALAALLVVSLRDLPTAFRPPPARTDTVRVNQLLAMGMRYVRRPGERARDLDSALWLARQATALSRALGYHPGEGRGYLVVAEALREGGDRQGGKACAERALRIFERHGLPGPAGLVYAELTQYYSNAAGDVVAKIHLQEQALACFQRAGNRKKQADVHKELGDLHQLRENYARSLRELKRALALYRSVGHPDVQGVYDLLGFVSTKTGDYKAGLAYGLLAMKTARRLGDTTLQMCTIYNRLGVTYQSLGKAGQAHRYFRQSLSIAQQKRHVPSVVHLAGNVSSVLLGLGKPREALAFLRDIAARYPPADAESRMLLATRLMDAYRSLGQYARAQPHCTLALQLAARHGAGSTGLAAIYQPVIQFLLASRQYESARKYLDINQALCRQQGSAGALATNHLLWFRLDSTLGNYPAAIRHYQRYLALGDSLLTQTKNRQIAQLEIGYQTEKKDQALRLKEKNIQLLTQQGKLQQQQLERARMIRNGTVAGSLMLALLLGLGYNRYRLRQRGNRLLEAKQREINRQSRSLERVLRDKEGLLSEKEWMLREIHHRVRNNLQIVTSLLNAQAGYLSDNAALSTIKESQHRVQAMALIHQKLYQSGQMARVEMAAYLHDLVGYLRDAYRPAGGMHLVLDVPPLDLDVTLAVPLGLIVNEAMTNALKYALRGGKPGTVRLSLHRQAPGTDCELVIADDGPGLPPGYDPPRSRSLGMTLMHGLGEQLGGELRITGSPGVTLRLSFPDEQPGRPVTEAGNGQQGDLGFGT